MSEGPYRVHPPAKDAPCVWVPSQELTVQWLGPLNDFNTVQEFNTWRGRRVPSNVEVERTRHTVLMQCDHNAIQKIHSLMHRRDVQMAEMVLFTRRFNNAVLGYDFQRNEPMVLLYPGA